VEGLHYWHRRARAALGAVRAQGKGGRVEPLHAKTRYTVSSWSSKPNHADAPRGDQQAGVAALLDTIAQCLKPC
jgi:hypothetical protein